MTQLTIYETIQAALEESRLDDCVRPADPPLVEFGALDAVSITINIDGDRFPHWDALVLMPSDDDPPLWAARLLNIVESRSIDAPPGLDDRVPDAPDLASLLRPLGEAVHASP